MNFKLNYAVLYVMKKSKLASFSSKPKTLQRLNEQMVNYIIQLPVTITLAARLCGERKEFFD